MTNLSHVNDLQVGQAAPDFSLLDQQGHAHSLKQYLGQWVVLYFYPKDDTPGCTQEACEFRDDYTVLQANNTQVLGVSLDNSSRHAAFSTKHRLPFPLLTDTNGQVARQYQALLNLGIIKIAKRHTFIIDPQGTIQKIYRKVNAHTHSKQILDDLADLQA